MLKSIKLEHLYNYLLTNAIDIKYFGLGFIQVTTLNSRYHFYHESLKKDAIDEGIHTHRYNFSSKILKGCLTEMRYEIIKGSTHILYNVNCGRRVHMEFNPEVRIGIKLKSVVHHTQGEEYFCPFNTFHLVGFSRNTITLLQKDDEIVSHAQAIIKIGESYLCPLKTKLNEKQLWDLVKQTIE